MTYPKAAFYPPETPIVPSKNDTPDLATSRVIHPDNYYVHLMRLAFTLNDLMYGNTMANQSIFRSPEAALLCLLY